MKTPLVSIVTPAFNSAQFIAETIQSVQNQTYQNWEMIIVDDFSTDETVAEISKFLEDSRIKCFQLKENSGAGIARQKAVDLAKGNFIAFLDADDLWLPEKLSKQINFLQKNNLPFTFSFYNCINDQGTNLNKIVKAPQILTFRQLFWRNHIGNLTGIYSVDFFGKIAISRFRKRQDWMMWLVILKKIKIAQPVPEVLASYRVRKSSVSSSKINLLKHNYNVYRHFHKLSAVESVFCMMGFLFVHFFLKAKYIEKT
ncbi:glycosyltransferase [Flavobacterium sp. NST-5]|uniref:Glycosyltransferase n=1 Tax=Flavobacterium ichthyis TaxID=2698827 RepID=A0ABW9ZA73_9FLAO|nr:glycosyltransferase family 2 protein [Flavobacterium ichthyis]NBL65793.1 glycosyltransferase [Flavobacterium ichthyis]